MMDLDAWQKEWDLVTAAPVPAIAALLVATVIGWFARLYVEGGQVNELQARLGTRDERLKLTQDALERALRDGGSPDAARSHEPHGEPKSTASANDNRMATLRDLQRPDRAAGQRRPR